MIGDVDAEAVAGLLNDLLEFDFKNDEVVFDDFNTEHLIYTALNLIAPNTAEVPAAASMWLPKALAPAHLDQTIMVVVVIATTATASIGLFLALKKRREELDVNA